MFKSLAVVSILTTAAFAQGSSSSSVIPSGISAPCSTFLTALNNDPGLKACASALTAATASFAPGSSKTPSAEVITSSLNTFCSSTTSASCSATSLRSNLTSFYQACQTELTSSPPNTPVLTLYDTLYVSSPFRSSVCATDDSGAYCGLKSKPNVDVSQVQKYLTTSQTVLSPNVTTYTNSNILFLLIDPTASSDALCTSCTRNVLMAYSAFESSLPHAAGLEQSTLLSKQQSLYKQVLATCGSNFLSTVGAAGGLGNNGPIGSSGAPQTSASLISSIVAVMGAVAVGIASSL